MKLAELAFACCAFQIFERGYQEAYTRFLEKTEGAFALHNKRHREALLTWLNKWRCRIPKKSFEEISEKLLTWFGKYKRSFPQEGKRLLDLSDEEIIRVAEVYKGLLEIKFIDATIASKILFALRSDVYPIWDNAMRKEYGSKGCSTYEEYMKLIKSELLELKDACKNNKIEIDELPDKLNRKSASLVKLLDEYHWTVMTRKVTLPSAEELQRWCQWASASN